MKYGDKIARLSLVLAAATAASLLTACSISPPRPPSADEIVGVWVNGDTRLVLAADGTFAIEDAPAYTAVGEGERWRDGADPTWDEIGEWNVESDAVRIRGQKLYYEYGRGELTLHIGFDLGSDDPRCFELVREDSSLSARGPEECFIRP